MPDEKKKPVEQPAAPVKAAKQKYRVLRGLNWLANPSDPESLQRAEAGDVRDDLLEKSTPWLLRDGLIEKVEG